MTRACHVCKLVPTSFLKKQGKVPGGEDAEKSMRMYICIHVFGHGAGLGKENRGRGGRRSIIG